MNDELITLEVDDAKVRQIIAKIRKSIKSFSITSGKSFILHQEMNYSVQSII